MNTKTKNKKRKTKKKKEEDGRRSGKGEEDPVGLAMAAADSGAKPLQNAMKMAKVAIQLDGGNKHKVVSYTA